VDARDVFLVVCRVFCAKVVDATSCEGFLVLLTVGLSGGKIIQEVKSEIS